MTNIINFSRKLGAKDKKKRVKRALIRGLIFGTAGGAISTGVGQILNQGWRKLRKMPTNVSPGKVGTALAAGAIVGGLGEAVREGVLEKYKQSKEYQKNKELRKLVEYKIAPIVNFNKQEVKVKSFTRQGKIVQSYTRKAEKKKQKRILQTVGLVALGVGVAAAIANRGKLYNTYKLSQVQSSINKMPITKLTASVKSSPVEKLNIIENINALKTNSTNTVKMVTKDGEKFIYKEGRNDIYNPLLSNAGMGVYAHGNEQATEALVSKIGKQAGINVQDTTIVSGNQIFPGKTLGLPGSLHSVVDGVPIGKVFKDFAFVMPHSNITGDYSKVFKNILHNEDTAKIGALDVFIGNADRNSSNLFYNVNTKAFTAIDNGSAYTLPLNYELLKQEVKPGSLTTAERKNLNVFRDTLRKLHQQNTPQSLSKEYDRGFTQATTGMNESDFKKALDSRDKRTRNIFYNHKESKDFLDHLDKLLS